MNTFVSRAVNCLNRYLKKTGKFLIAAAVILAFAYFLPVVFAVILLCGVIDVTRNLELDVSVFRQYFLKNGVGTWLASPFNLVLDVLALPFRNKGVYRLEDLPETYRSEISALLETVDRLKLPDLLDRHTQGLKRAMFFFKWYGKNLDNVLPVDEFHRDYRYVRTIGVSMFKQRESTSRHFGPFRASLRVLYCLNEITDPESYIKVGPVENRWMENRLFIFDDTLLHQSFNETDRPRYVLFVDIIRPSYLPFVFEAAIGIIRLLFRGINGVFYRNWKLVNN